MKILPLTLLLVLFAATAQAACYADYKASRENPLELQYGVAEVFGDCSVDEATTVRRGRNPMLL